MSRWSNARRDAERMLDAMPSSVLAEGSVALAWYETADDLQLLQPANTWPLDYHQIVIRAAQRILLTKGTKVQLVPVSAAAYFAWLGDRENTANRRAEYLALATHARLTK